MLGNGDWITSFQLSYKLLLLHCVSELVCPDGSPIKGTCGGIVDERCKFSCIYPNGPMGYCCGNIFI